MPGAAARALACQPASRLRSAARRTPFCRWFSRWSRKAPTSGASRSSICNFEAAVGAVPTQKPALAVGIAIGGKLYEGWLDADLSNDP
jgi:hypothetical protein